MASWDKHTCTKNGVTHYVDEFFLWKPDVFTRAFRTLCGERISRWFYTGDGRPNPKFDTPSKTPNCLECIDLEGEEPDIL